jgi:hypothetical protein
MVLSNRPWASARERVGARGPSLDRGSSKDAIAVEFREVRLQDLWRDTHPGERVPADVERLRSWECVHDSRTPTGERTRDGSEILQLPSRP